MRNIYTPESIKIRYPNANIICRDGEILEHELYIVCEGSTGIDKMLNVVLEQLCFKIET